MKEKIKVILEEHYKQTEEMAKAIISELKQECKTYGELDRAINIMIGDTRWAYSNAGKYESLFNEIRKLVKEEKGNIKINKNPHTIVIKLDAEQFQKDIKEITEEIKKVSGRYQEAIDKLKREGIKIVM